MTKNLLLILFLCGSGLAFGQKVAVKHNFAYDAWKTPNLSAEVALGRKWTFDVQGGMNSFFYTKNATSPHYKTKKFSHWLVQPELRLWTCDVFNGWFFGLHAHGGKVNIGGIKVPFILHRKGEDMKAHRYEGGFYGGGISAGYQWLLSNRFNLEVEAGVGYARLRYDRYKCVSCGGKDGGSHADYLGPTKAALSIVYFLK